MYKYHLSGITLYNHGMADENYIYIKIDLVFNYSLFSQISIV